ncbi:hypothetical protein SORBI_3006G067050 [Sorghum bicolor]|uniref:Uncharacterized protein n=1 Tax=Sorghum bicolor TaxID=4558 RepID=A0A1Z5RDP4_SORBI|nr:hypothetical protein SORBI_3006G067050 [Sorghum bicolor]
MERIIRSSLVLSLTLLDIKEQNIDFIKQGNSMFGNLGGTEDAPTPIISVTKQQGFRKQRKGRQMDRRVTLLLKSYIRVLILLFCFLADKLLMPYSIKL